MYCECGRETSSKSGLCLDCDGKKHHVCEKCKKHAVWRKDRPCYWCLNEHKFRARMNAVPRETSEFRRAASMIAGCKNAVRMAESEGGITLGQIGIEIRKTNGRQHTRWLTLNDLLEAVKMLKGSRVTATGPDGKPVNPYSANYFPMGHEVVRL